MRYSESFPFFSSKNNTIYFLSFFDVRIAHFEIFETFYNAQLQPTVPVPHQCSVVQTERKPSKSTKTVNHLKNNFDYKESRFILDYKESTCPVCFKTFYNVSNMRRHTEIHRFKRKNFICQKCHRRFSWKTHLMSHIKHFHNIK